MNEFELELRALLNRMSQENASNTPDFILAQYLSACLDAWNTATQQRETWYGRDPRPSPPQESDREPDSMKPGYRVRVLPGPFRKKSRIGILIADPDPNSHLYMGRGPRILWEDTGEEDYLGSMEQYERVF